MNFQRFRLVSTDFLRLLLCLQLTISAPLAWAEEVKPTPPTEVELGARSLMSLKRGSYAATAPEQKQVLKAILQHPLPFFEPVAGRDERIFVPGDPMTDEALDALDAIMELTTLAGFTNSTPLDFHKANEKLIQNLIADIHAHPADYGLDAEQVENINDLTDIDFEVALEALINQRAVQVSKYGAATLSVLENFINRYLDKTRFWGWYVVKSLGLEPTVMTFVTSQSMKQIYLLHRLYTFMTHKRMVAESQNKGLDDIEAMREFRKSLKTFQFDERFKIEMFKAWLMAFFTGTTMKTMVGRDTIEWTSRGALRWMGKKGQNLRIKGYRPVYHFAERFRSIFRAGDWSSLYMTMRLPPGSLISEKIMKDELTDEDRQNLEKRFARSQRFTKNLMKSPVFRWVSHKMKGILSPKSILLTGADYGVRRWGLYALTYNVLFYSSRILAGTYISPGHAIQSALLSDDDFNPQLVEGTRKVFYPLCIHLAHNAKSRLPRPEDREARVNACQTLIQAFEGVKKDEIKELFPQFSQVLTAGDVQVFSLSDEKIQELIESAWKYPVDFRITWLSALRSIFSIDHVPSMYYMTVQKMLVSPSPEMTLDSLPQSINSELLRLDTQTASALTNLTRLNDAVEMLSAERFRRLYNQEVIAGNKAGPEIAPFCSFDDDNNYSCSAGDDRIWQNMPTLKKGFLIYFLHQRTNTVAHRDEVRQMAKKYEDVGGTDSFFKVMVSPFVGRDSHAITKLPPKVYSSRYRIEVEIDDLVDETTSPQTEDTEAEEMKEN